MFMGQDIPIAASASGGIYHYKDGRTAPDTINVLLEYPTEFTATFEATLAPGIGGQRRSSSAARGAADDHRPRPLRVLEVPPSSAAALAHADGGASRRQATWTCDHVQNFLECVKSRKLPNGDVLIGHRSAQASHLGNIAYLEKRTIKFDPVREQILG